MKTRCSGEVRIERAHQELGAKERGEGEHSAQLRNGLTKFRIRVEMVPALRHYKGSDILTGFMK